MTDDLWAEARELDETYPADTRNDAARMARLALRTWDYAVAAIRAEAEAVRESDSDLAATEARVADLELQLVEAGQALDGAIEHAEARDREAAELRAVVAAVEAELAKFECAECHPRRGWEDTPCGLTCALRQKVRAALSDAPSALAEVKAAAWDEGKWDAYHAERDGYDGSEVPNPYDREDGAR